MSESDSGSEISVCGCVWGLRCFVAWVSPFLLFLASTSVLSASSSCYKVWVWVSSSRSFARPFAYRMYAPLFCRVFVVCCTVVSMYNSVRVLYIGVLSPDKPYALFCSYYALV